MSWQHPKLKLQNMGGGELRTGDMMPCQNTTMRTLWRTASTSHVFACKVWIFRSFNGAFFFCVLCLFFKGFTEFKTGGSCYFFKEGDLKTILRGRGGSFIGSTYPSLLYPPPPLRERIRSSDVRDFLTFKKTI
jgi:hypothetical protein